MPLVYEELRRLAAGYLRNERPEHTLQRTALVHEAYLRLVAQGRISWKIRSFARHFCPPDAPDSDEPCRGPKASETRRR